MPDNNIQKHLFKLNPDVFARNKTIALLLEAMDIPKPGHILHVGGLNSKLGLFLPEGYKLIVVDEKPRETGQVQQLGDSPVTQDLIADTTLTASNYVQGDIKKLPFPDNSFEVVIAADLLAEVKKEDRNTLMEELCRVSKNYILIGAPFKKEFVDSVENLVAQQFVENSRVKHPVLGEHYKNGLPEHKEVESFIKAKGFASTTIGEGNLINWAMHQFVSGGKQGEKGAEEFTGFNEFFNQNLYNLGNYNEPTYRTFFCISKEKTINANAITLAVAAANTFNVRTFCAAMKIAFTEDRKMLNRRKKQLNVLADAVLSAREKMAVLKEQNDELSSQLQEKQSALQLLQANEQQKSTRLSHLEAEHAVLSTEINNAKTLIQSQDSFLQSFKHEVENLKQYLQKHEQTLKGIQIELHEKNTKLEENNLSLNQYKSSLEEVTSSKAWKVAVTLRKFKNAMWTKPGKAIRKIFKADSSLKAKNVVVQPQTIAQLVKEQESFEYRPVISIVMPVYNANEEFLIKAIESVKKQTYPRFELCIGDDGSTIPFIKPLLEKYAKEDERIRVHFRGKSAGVVKVSNETLKMAQGAYVGFLDSDDELEPNALHEVVKALQKKKFDLIYSDEDKLDQHGNSAEPFFKPDWSPDLLLSINYIGHFTVLRRKLVNDLGEFRESVEGSHDYDLILRVVEKTSSIHHISKILYHSRKIQGTTVVDAGAKPPFTDSKKKALEDALKRRHIQGIVTEGLWTGSYRVKRTLETKPLVSIIIPVKDRKESLQNCLKTLFAHTNYLNYEVIINGSPSELFETEEYLEVLSKNPKIVIINDKKSATGRNMSGMINDAAKHAKGEYLVFLHQEAEVITGDWIESMLEHAERKEVGAVGAKLLYHDNTLWHAGVLIGVGGVAKNAFRRHSNIDHGYFGQVDVIRNYSAVGTGCLMVQKAIFLDLNGFNEEDLSDSLSDVDFCLQLRQKGYLIVYTPFASLYWNEDVKSEKSSPENEENVKGVEYIHKKYAEIFKDGDPYYNPNLNQKNADFKVIS